MFSFYLGKYRSSSPFFPSFPPSTVISAQGCLWLPCCSRSLAKWCLTLCSLMDCSMAGFPVLHYLPESAQTHVRWISDAIQPSHPLLCHIIKDFPAVALCILSTLFSCSYLDWNHHCIFRIKQIVILRFQFYLTNLRKFNHYSNSFLVFWFWLLTSSSLRNFFFFFFVNWYKG